MITDEYLKERSVEVGECWEWTGAMSNGATPVFRPPGKKTLAVRIAIAQRKGLTVTSKTPATTTCSNPKCVNPEHVVVKPRTFIQRRAAKETGYAQRASRNAKIAAAARARLSTLTPEMVQAIRDAEGFAREVGAKFGISKSSVIDIRAGDTWKTYTSPWAGLGAR